ncbi:hypothetical protein [Candidatus Manganitrophus noduliformans]|uniref:Uncharacterized protein n=1 Tax=Candidatus Manganitrophus noduliformans TaxID=2606439 RepID=A0A7X6ICN5_9BACT|nr:hypothetical protein [Candidatus Manganitrophus noduliformans]NKE72878.1 hypothetical protein [Candidatus Manganitrophus noduliformans]
MGSEVVQINPSELLKQETEITDRDFYEVYDPRIRRKKKVPSARVYNNWAKEAGIKTKILDAGCDSEKAWAHVKGWLGEEANPLLQREARVTILWKIEFESLVWDAIADREKKKPYTVGPDGYPVLTNPADQLALIRQLSRIKRFGERTAVTKAEAIVEKKLLGVEYREPEEIRHEKREVQAVSETQDGTLHVKEEGIERETGEGFEPPSGVDRPKSGAGEAGAEDSKGKTESDLPKIPVPLPAGSAPLPSPFKRSLTRVVQVNGKRLRTAGIEAAQLAQIWKAAEEHGNEKIAPLLKEFGAEKSTHLTKEEGDQVLGRLARLPAAERNGAETLPV